MRRSGLHNVESDDWSLKSQLNRNSVGTLNVVPAVLLQFKTFFTFFYTRAKNHILEIFVTKPEDLPHYPAGLTKVGLNGGI